MSKKRKAERDSARLLKETDYHCEAWLGGETALSGYCGRRAVAELFGACFCKRHFLMNVGDINKVAEKLK